MSIDVNILSKIDVSATLPEGYTQRAATLDDADAVANVMTIAVRAQGHNELITGDLIRRDWNGNPKWDVTASSQVVFNPQGEMVGAVSIFDIYNPTHPGINCDVIPGEHWETVMRVLMAWAEQTALRALERCQPEERFAPATGTDVDSQKYVFLTSIGYQPVRYFYEMGLTLQEAPPVMPLPEGFTIDTLDYPTELEEMVTAYDDMWQDHYGYVPRPVSDIVADWTRFIESDPDFDPTMWYIARHDATGEIAGLVMCQFKSVTKADEGYIMLVGVRRAYRKQGLAQAMLMHAFADYWRRDQKTVSLSVDASSPTGATKLYERVGMAITQRRVRMEKELRPGTERMNTGR